jgi:hypothetical protein
MDDAHVDAYSMSGAGVGRRISEFAFLPGHLFKARQGLLDI